MITITAPGIQPGRFSLVLRLLLTVITFASGLIGCTPTNPDRPELTAPQARAVTHSFLIIAHRGASGYRPEHTLAAYQLAIDQGADYIEPDLVPTRDGHLIARHENALALVEFPGAGNLRERQTAGTLKIHSATTDVAEREEFAHLLRVREIDGRKVAGWFSEDFTLAEIKTLWARERIPKLRAANANYTSERVPSLEDILALVKQPGNTHVGLYPELKHPTHFRYGSRTAGGPPINIDTAQLLVAALERSPPPNHKPLYIQCFEVETLRRLRHELLSASATLNPTQSETTAPKIRLVQLFGSMSATPADVAYHSKNSSPAELAAVYGPLQRILQNNPSYAAIASALPKVAADYANGLGPRKGDTRKLAANSKALGLELHPYTIRAEPFFLSPLRGGLATTVAEELTTLQAMGATGVFIDHPDLAVSWRAGAAQQTAPTP